MAWVLQTLAACGGCGHTCQMNRDIRLSEDDGPQPDKVQLLPGLLRPRRLHVVLIVLIVLTCLPEIGLVLADWGLIGSPRWRLLAYQYGAFWAGLLYGWEPNYAAQPVVMFFSYGFLHTGLWHLAGNLLGLGWLGQRIIGRWSPGLFIGLYLAALLGGAAGFGALSRNPAPMVGASGAIFGLAAVWIGAQWQDRHHSGLRSWAACGPAVMLTLALIGLNGLIWVLEQGQLAWETHLGGFLAGAVAAALLIRFRVARPNPI